MRKKIKEKWRTNVERDYFLFYLNQIDGSLKITLLVR